ncbi:class I SAM-dependent methyltransferase [bacterium]|nr:class I SAM-dependent methyltransferase [bacterium]
MNNKPDTLKSFAQIHEDYAFFERHADESEASLAAWLPLVHNRWSRVRALDFGSGSGSFTSLFLDRAHFSPDQLDLTLVEPDQGFREQAIARLTPFCTRPITAWSLLDRDLEPGFELIFSHHVLYYVPNLEETLGRLHQGLVPGGRMLLVQGGQGNGLNRLVIDAFAHLGGTPPYQYSEDTQAALRRLGIGYRLETVRSSLKFADSEAARWRILRFLLGEHLPRLKPDLATALFQPWLTGDQVRVDSADELFIIDR